MSFAILSNQLKIIIMLYRLKVIKNFPIPHWDIPDIWDDFVHSDEYMEYSQYVITEDDTHYQICEVI